MERGEFIFLLPDGRAFKVAAWSAKDARREGRKVAGGRNLMVGTQILQIKQRMACLPSMEDAAVVLRPRGQGQGAGVAA